MLSAWLKESQILAAIGVFVSSEGSRVCRPASLNDEPVIVEVGICMRSRGMKVGAIAVAAVIGSVVLAGCGDDGRTGAKGAGASASASNWRRRRWSGAGYVGGACGL